MGRGGVAVEEMRRNIKINICIFSTIIHEIIAFLLPPPPQRRSRREISRGNAIRKREASSGLTDLLFRLRSKPYYYDQEDRQRGAGKRRMGYVWRTLFSLKKFEENICIFVKPFRWNNDKYQDFNRLYNKLRGESEGNYCSPGEQGGRGGWIGLFRERSGYLMLK